MEMYFSILVLHLLLLPHFSAREDSVWLEIKFADVRPMENGQDDNQLARVRLLKSFGFYYFLTLEISCPKLEPPKYGKIYVSGNYPGDHAIYDCVYGYKIVGKRRRVCLYTGSWSGSNTDCAKDDSYGDDYGYGYRSHDRYD